MDKLRMESPDMTAQNIDKIAALFPNCVTEASDGHGGIKRAINFEMLKQMLSPDVVDGDERYEFTWVGKKAAIVEANKPIRKTLRPCVEESKDWDTTENLYIEGDNLEVLKLLQESYLGKVKMIYIDPPYNTGNDFIYVYDFMRSQEEENEQMGMYRHLLSCLGVTRTGTVLSVAFPVTFKRFTALPTDKGIDCFAVHEILMSIPPDHSAGVGTKFFLSFVRCTLYCLFTLQTGFFKRNIRMSAAV